MTILHEHTDELIVTRCWCGVQHAVPKSLYGMQKRQHENGRKQVGIYCPLGHVWTLLGEEELVRVKRSLVNELAHHDQTRAELRETEARRRGEKAAKTRIKNRVAKGVCPCCNRYFVNLHRHMESQHPDYVNADK